MIFVFVGILVLLIQLFAAKRFFKSHLVQILLWNELVILLLVGSREMGIYIHESVYVIFLILGFILFQKSQTQVNKNTKEIEREI